jgi:hypothetical protein
MSDFVQTARVELEQWDLTRGVLAASGAEAYWHPTGFMVFRLKAMFGNRPVRLHVWPLGPRPIEPAHPMIHTHMWPLAGKVLCGTYTERVVQMEEDPQGPLTLFDVTYHDRDSATVIPRDSKLAIAAEAYRSYEVGQVHTLASGEWHETQIPETTMTATVLLSGNDELDGPSLAGAGAFEGGYAARQRVSHTDAEEALRRLTGVAASCELD